eukprot:126790-Pleurochrysis_carterae.AAC.1
MQERCARAYCRASHTTTTVEEAAFSAAGGCARSGGIELGERTRARLGCAHTVRTARRLERAREWTVSCASSRRNRVWRVQRKLTLMAAADLDGRWRVRLGELEVLERDVAPLLNRRPLRRVRCEQRWVAACLGVTETQFEMEQAGEEDMGEKGRGGEGKH